jgi:hypothetical protein
MILREVETDFDPTIERDRRGVLGIRFVLAYNTDLNCIAHMIVMLSPGHISGNILSTQQDSYDFMFGVREYYPGIIQKRTKTDFTGESSKRYIRDGD